ncbi:MULTISPECIES: endo-1,4-beta-xylanase [Streptomyces]|uniref:endo-1,4-beta-xylanase n=1 Tax=Streptomyces TaxID=1883 RepID=UPI0038061E75
MNSSRTGLRRAALAVLSAALVATAAGTAQAHPGKVGPAEGHHHGKGHPKPAASLRDLADRRHVLIGTAVDTTALAEDGAYRAATAREFSSVTAENAMKWEVVEPERGRYDWSAADELVRFARAHGQQVRGHTLLWHNQLPAWLTEGVADGSIDAKELRKILREHITAEVKHFKGKIYQWDVVNEVFEEDGSLRDSIWLQQLGPSYIADAFRWAHRADPGAKLFMNDYNVEGVNAKSTAYYELAKKLRAQGVPVQGMGVQAHLDIQYGFPTDLAANLARFDRLGLRTAITEADVRMFTPSDPAKLARQASDYRGLLAACLATKGCTSFTVWGFTDKYSWVPGTFEGEGEANILDADFRHKPAYEALREELAKRR